jgi:hypothetical protein
MTGRAINSLRNQSVAFVGDLLHQSPTELLRFPNVGQGFLIEFQQAMTDLHLQLGMEGPDWPYANLDQVDRAFANRLPLKLEVWRKRSPELNSLLFDTIQVQEDVAPLAPLWPLAVMTYKGVALWAFLDLEILKSILPLRIERQIRNETRGWGAPASKWLVKKISHWSTQELATTSIGELSGAQGKAKLKYIFRSGLPMQISSQGAIANIVIMPLRPEMPSK